MPAAAIFLLALVTIAFFLARKWPVVNDQSLLHYTVFLMDHGWKPYRDIIEMNMPGAYMLQWLPMHVFGGGVFGSWVWDSLMGAIVIASSAWIAGPGRRYAGLAAGSIVTLRHFYDGPWDFGQRDWVTTALLLAAVGCLFQCVRKAQLAWIAGFVALCGLAASVKPPALAFIILPCFGVWFLAQRPAPLAKWKTITLRALGWAALGALVPAAAVAGFLLHWGVTQDFLTTLHGLVPYYASLGHVALREFVVRSLLSGLLPLAVLLFLLGKAWRLWESNLLAVSSGIAVVLFFAQRKAYGYHLYPEIAFVCLLLLTEVDDWLHEESAVRRYAAAAVLLLLCLSSPKRLHSKHYPTETIDFLQADLRALGGSALSGKVQCIDMSMGGCINTLYNMQLLPATGSIYNFYLFPPSPTPLTEALQHRVLADLQNKPPQVIVVSSHQWAIGGVGYRQLQLWPGFEDFLRSGYVLSHTLPDPEGVAGYRLYTRK